jgi:peptide/nickel transport system substrate-binding protein
VRAILRWISAALLAGGMAVSSPYAAELKIGLNAEPSSMDPHYHNVWVNVAFSFHIFDRLIEQDEKQALRPGLALSWKAVGERTWEFKLRQGVKFHDGSEFTAEDVVFTLKRMPAVPNSPSSFGVYTSSIESTEIVDAHTLRVTTKAPYPLLPRDFSVFGIMGKKQASGPLPEGKTTQQLNAGDGLVGTGPYKFVEWVKGDRIVLARNPDYWGKKQPWERLVFKTIRADGARVAALLSGDVDLIEGVPPADLPRLRRDPKVKVWDSISNAVMHIMFDSFRDQTPGVSGTQGKNPLKDARVRKALSLAINRDAIVTRIMEGMAVSAAEVVPPFMFGANPDSKPDPYDPDQAKKLLADAGYPNGFKLVLGSPSDRYVRVSETSQAIASMWTRIGVETSVDASTITTFFTRRNQYEFSAFVGGSLAYTGEMSFLLKVLAATPTPNSLHGVINKGRYSNPKVDQLLRDAVSTNDEEKSRRLMQEASRIVMKEDHGMLVLHFDKRAWASRSTILFNPRVDTSTLAMEAKPAN